MIIYNILYFICMFIRNNNFIRKYKHILQRFYNNIILDKYIGHNLFYYYTFLASTLFILLHIKLFLFLYYMIGIMHL